MWITQLNAECRSTCMNKNSRYSSSFIKVTVNSNNNNKKQTLFSFLPYDCLRRMNQKGQNKTTRLKNHLFVFRDFAKKRKPSKKIQKSLRFRKNQLPFLGKISKKNRDGFQNTYIVTRYKVGKYTTMLLDHKIIEIVAYCCTNMTDNNKQQCIDIKRPKHCRCPHIHTAMRFDADNK